MDVRRAKKEKGTGYAGAAAEVCKYALKFGDLSVEHTWEAFKILKGRRLTGSFGLLWGVKIPEKATDDLPDDQSLPYLEMLYKFNYGKHSHYDLIVTRNVEPKAKAELEEEELRRPTDVVKLKNWRQRTKLSFSVVARRAARENEART